MTNPEHFPAAPRTVRYLTWSERNGWHHVLYAHRTIPASGEPDWEDHYRWPRYVVTSDGKILGGIAGRREFNGYRHLAPLFDVAHNPSDVPGHALWVSRGHRSVRAALRSLADHLDESTGSDADNQKGANR